MRHRSFPSATRRTLTGHPPAVRSALVSRFVEDIRRARSEGGLQARFRPDDVRHACPGWADHTYGVFLPKHRRGILEGTPPISSVMRTGPIAFWGKPEPVLGRSSPIIDLDSFRRLLSRGRDI